MRKLRFPKPVKRESVRKPVKRTSRPRKQRKGSRAALKRRCDALWASIVKRDGKCLFAGQEVNGKPHVCKNGLQAMHGIPRYYHATRFDVQNGFPGCGGVHTYYSIRKEEWTRWLLTTWGPELFAAMWLRALKVTKLDYAQVLLTLEAEAERQSVA